MHGSQKGADRSGSKWKWIVSGGVIASAVIAAAYWYHGRNNLLSEIPERKASSQTIPARESMVNLRLAIPFSVMKAAAENKIPSTFQGGGNGSDFCLPPLGFPCAGTKYDYTVTRSGDFDVKRVDDRNVSIDFGIKARGHGGFRGTVAEIFSVHAKSFEAEAKIRAVFALNMNADWCPDLPMTITYDWVLHPQVEIVGGVWVPLNNDVNEKIRERLGLLPIQLKSAIPCDQVRKAVAEAWKPYAFPVTIPNAPPMTVVINPQSLGTSGMIVTDKDIRVVVNAKAETSLFVGSNAPPLPEKGPLPPATPVTDGPGRVEIALPIQASYDALRKAVTDATKEPVPFDVGGKPGQLVVKGIEMYPSGERMTVGLKFEADAPGRPFDVSGDVYFTSAPTVSEDGQSISLRDVGFSRRLDNSLWNVLSAALEGEVRKRVEQAKLDLKPQIESALSSMRTAIADPTRTGGIKLTVANPSLKIERIVPGSEAITVVTLVSADVEGELVSPFK